MQGIQQNASLTTLLGKTIRSRKALENSGGMGYLWAQFTKDGISYGQGGEASPTFNNPLKASKDAFDNYSATFTGTVNGNEQSGDITIQVGSGIITNVQVKFTKGTSYDNQVIDCQFVNQ